MSATKKKPRRVLRFAVSGVLLVGAGSLSACGDDADDGPTINEPYHEAPTPNSPAPLPEEREIAEMSSNEPAPEPQEGTEETAEGAAGNEAEAEAE